jgi:hypothetical protein
MKTKWVVAASLAWSMMASVAWADLAPPGAWECTGKDVGASCDVGGRDTAPLRQCEPIDWTSHVQCDAGGVPCNNSVVGNACCIPTKINVCTETDAGAADGGAPEAGSSYAGSTATTAPAPASDSSSCSVPGALTRTVGPWALAGSVSLLLLLKRRRRS